jgi:predicted HicB family RNase H-like nuclease
MPKPPLPPDIFKGKKIEVRYNEKEYQALLNLAKGNGMTISQFIRKCVQEWAQSKMEKRNKIPDYV